MYEVDLRQYLRDSVVQRRTDKTAAAAAETKALLNGPAIRHTHMQPEMIYS